jgi:catechol 2,3-dioxygenase-like lactoylglutathione lyase family enzyme
MDLLHVALAASSEDVADAFYVDVLGLEKAEPKLLAAEISRALFGIDRELTILNYTGEAAHFEVFVGPVAPTRRVEHACIAVADLPELLRKCETLQVEVIRVPKGESLITFIKDGDGDLFEIKERAASLSRRAAAL